MGAKTDTATGDATGTNIWIGDEGTIAFDSPGAYSEKLAQTMPSTQSVLWQLVSSERFTKDLKRAHAALDNGRKCTLCWGSGTCTESTHQVRVGLRKGAPVYANGPALEEHINSVIFEKQLCINNVTDQLLWCRLNGSEACCLPSIVANTAMAGFSGLSHVGLDYFAKTWITCGKSVFMGLEECMVKKFNATWLPNMISDIKKDGGLIEQWDNHNPYRGNRTLTVGPNGSSRSVCAIARMYTTFDGSTMNRRADRPPANITFRAEHMSNFFNNVTDGYARWLEPEKLVTHFTFGGSVGKFTPFTNSLIPGDPNQPDCRLHDYKVQPMLPLKSSSYVDNYRLIKNHHDEIGTACKEQGVDVFRPADSEFILKMFAICCAELPYDPDLLWPIIEGLCKFHLGKHIKDGNFCSDDMLSRIWIPLFTQVTPFRVKHWQSICRRFNDDHDRGNPLPQPMTTANLVARLRERYPIPLESIVDLELDGTCFGWTLEQRVETGLDVVNVVCGSQADRKGLMGKRLVAFGRTKVSSLETLRQAAQAVQPVQPGEMIRATFVPTEWGRQPRHSDKDIVSHALSQLELKFIADDPLMTLDKKAEYAFRFMKAIDTMREKLNDSESETASVSSILDAVCAILGMDHDYGVRGSPLQPYVTTKVVPLAEACARRIENFIDVDNDDDIDLINDTTTLPVDTGELDIPDNVNETTVHALAGRVEGVAQEMANGSELQRSEENSENDGLFTCMCGQHGDRDYDDGQEMWACKECGVFQHAEHIRETWVRGSRRSSTAVTKDIYEAHGCHMCFPNMYAASLLEDVERRVQNEKERERQRASERVEDAGSDSDSDGDSGGDNKGGSGGGGHGSSSSGSGEDSTAKAGAAGPAPGDGWANNANMRKSPSDCGKTKSCRCTRGCLRSCPCYREMNGSKQEGCGECCSCTNCQNRKGRGGLSPSDEMTQATTHQERKATKTNFAKQDRCYMSLYYCWTEYRPELVTKIVENYPDAKDFDEALRLLSDENPDFAELWMLYEWDLTIAVKGVQDFEDGNPLTFLQCLPALTCYYLHHGMDNIAMVALLLLHKFLYYAETTTPRAADATNAQTFASSHSNALRGDILLTYGRNCKKMDETFIEFLNSLNMRHLSSYASLDFSVLKKKNDSTMAKSRTVRELREAAGLKRGQGPSELRQIRERFKKEAYAETKATIIGFIRHSFNKSLSMQFPAEAAEPVRINNKIASGAKRLPGLLIRMKETAKQWTETTGWHQLKKHELEVVCQELQLSHDGTRKDMWERIIQKGVRYFPYMSKKQATAEQEAAERAEREEQAEAEAATLDDNGMEE